MVKQSIVLHNAADSELFTINKKKKSGKRSAPKGSKAYILNISLDGLIITIAPEKPIMIAIHFQKSILVPKIGIEKIATIKGVNKVKEVAVANLRKINEVKKQS